MHETLHQYILAMNLQSPPEHAGTSEPGGDPAGPHLY